MKAIVVHEHGGLDRLRVENVPDPKPAADEVLVEVRACALNHLDLWVRRGVPGHAFPLPMIPGCDVAGIVREVGSVARGVAVGDAVVVAPGLACGRCEACSSGNDNLCRFYGILGETRNGGYAALVAVPAANALPLPKGLSFEEAAAVPLVFLTAWHMLVVRAELRAGEEVLVQAGGSGVGSAAIQIAKLLGARVYTTVSSDAKADRARALGADEVIVHTKEDFAARVRDLTGKRGVDVVFEHTGSETFAKGLRSLAKGGRLVTCGATSGFEVPIDLRPIFFKSLSILGSTMGSRGELHQILRLVEQRRLRPVIERTFPLEEAANAQSMLEERRAFGKVVLVPRR
ncbi:MAG: zinc-binding dehydrogenase [Planctomycetes bacterium]|nr:zinc-binding dehydrogenase [Planctomycetota bacterium]